MKIKLLIGALAAAMLLSACGGKGGDSSTDATMPPETTAPEAMPPADETTPPADEMTAPEGTPPESTPPESAPPQN